MSVLSDGDLASLYPGCKPEPASIDLHIGDTLTIWPDYVRRDPRYDQSRLWKPVELENAGGPNLVWVLKPGRRYLAATAERIKILPNYAGELTGRSSWGRDGLEIHRTAGWIDSGYEGNPTLELSVVGSELVVWPGARVCQLIIHELTSEAVRPYGHPDRKSKYQGDSGPTPSRSYQEWECDANTPTIAETTWGRDTEVWRNSMRVYVTAPQPSRLSPAPLAASSSVGGAA